MEIIDIIRLATERAEQTGDISRPEFHAVVCVIGRMCGNSPLADLAHETEMALIKANSAQMQFRELLQK